MHFAQVAKIVHVAGTLVDRGNFMAGEANFELTWDDLSKMEVPPDESGLELYTGAICLRSFLDRLQGECNHDPAPELYGNVQTRLLDMEGAVWVSQLQCVIAANMADGHRQRQDHQMAEILFQRAHVFASEGVGSVGAIAALMQGIMWLEVGDETKRANEALLYAGQAILSRPTNYARYIQGVATAVLIHLYGNDVDMLRVALGLSSITAIPRAHPELLDGLNAAKLEGGQSQIYSNLFVPLYRPI